MSDQGTLPPLNTYTAQDVAEEDLVEAIDRHWEAAQTGDRAHLGASQIGEPCERKLVYSFRHACKAKFDGRMLRLFDRGHREEERFLTYLAQVGFDLQPFKEMLTYHASSESYSKQPWDVPLPQGCTNVTLDFRHIAAAELAGVKLKQWNFKKFGGHYSGSTDGNGMLPEHAARRFVGIPVGVRFLTEFKTYGSKQFAKLLDAKNEAGARKDGNTAVGLAKPLHYCQMQTYMVELKLPFGVYMAVNKDTDALFWEVIPQVATVPVETEARALRVISARALPKRLSNHAAFWECKFCTYRLPCHFNAPLDVHCRTCRHVVATDGSRFYCGKWQNTIPLDVVAIGCGSYEVITD